MSCKLEIPDEIKKQFSKLKSKDGAMFARVMKKIREIIENPTTVGDAKHYNYAGCRTAHIGPFVLMWEPIPPLKPEVVKIVLFEHHDSAY